MLAPLTWPLLIAAAIAAWLGERRQREHLPGSRARLIATAGFQSLPSVAILLCGVVDNSMVPGGRSYEYLIPVALLAQLPMAFIAYWWCQKAGLYSIAVGFAWAAFSISAAFTVSTWGRPL
jgi:hypothetical protein